MSVSPAGEYGTVFRPDIKAEILFPPVYIVRIKLKCQEKKWKQSWTKSGDDKFASQE